MNIKDIKERLMAAFSGKTPEKIIGTPADDKRLAASSAVDEAQGWRKLTGDTSRELIGLTKDREIEIAYWLWKTNPLARWIVNIMSTFVCGNGFTLEASNEDVKNLLTSFWNHPLNNMPLNLPKHVKELSVFGELLFPKFVSQYSGKIALGYIDPAQIKTVVTDPENVKIVIGVQTRGKDFRDGKKYKTVISAEAEEFLSPDAQAWRDTCQYECYYFSINNLSNEPRGQSDLFDIADWLDAYEQFLYDYADKWPLLNTFVWDLVVTGADGPALDEQLKRFTKKSGSVYAHNEKVKLDASTPDLKAVDAKEGAALFRNHILGSKSIPSFWFGGAQDSNLAVSQEMSAPTYKTFTERQMIVIYICKFILDDVLREADVHGMLNGVKDEEKGYTLDTPELANKDITKFASAIQQLTSSLVAAVTNGWIDTPTAVKAFAFALAMIGFELNVDEMEKAVAVEKENTGVKDYLKKPGTGENGN